MAAQGRRKRGGILSRERMPPCTPPREREGSSPRPPTLAVCSLKSCTRCAIGCGVHGFAMNPCESLPVATAPYYREARVTFAWRQTAYRMRHCFARRIEECHGRRKLSCTSIRWAERQRIIGAEANRLATPNAATPRAGSRIPEAQRSFKLWTANLSLSLGVPKGPFSFAKENGPFAPAARRRHIPPRRAWKVVHPFAARKKRAVLSDSSFQIFVPYSVTKGSRAI